MDDSFQKKSIGETMVNTAFQHAFCRNVRVVERLYFLLDFDKHSSLFIQLLHIYIYIYIYIYVINIV